MRNGYLIASYLIMGNTTIMYTSVLPIFTHFTETARLELRRRGREKKIDCRRLKKKKNKRERREEEKLAGRRRRIKREEEESRKK